MSIEDDIRHTLRDDAGDATPPPSGWDDVRIRVATGPRSRRARRAPVVALAAAATIAAIVVGVAALRSTSDSTPSVATPSALPSEAILALVDQRLVVIDAENGAQRQTLAENVQSFFSVDDEYVYFSREADQRCNDIAIVFEIVRVPLTGGPAEFVADGTSPHVSPDGRRLAYMTGSAAFLAFDEDDPRLAECRQGPYMVVRDLASGDERQYTVPGTTADPPRASVNPLGWTADSSRLLYEVYRGGDVPQEPRPARRRLRERRTRRIELAGGREVPWCPQRVRCEP